MRSVVAPVLPPVLAAAVLGGAALLGLSDDASAERTHSGLLGAVHALPQLTHVLGSERAATDRLVRGDDRARVDLDAARARVDAQLTITTGTLGQSDTTAARYLDRELGAAASSLLVVRSQVDGKGDADGQDYLRISRSLADAVTEAGVLMDEPRIAAAMERFGLLLTAVDTADAERDLGLLVLDGTADAEDATRRGALATEQLVALNQWGQLTTSAERSKLLTAEAPDASGTWSLRTAREALASGDPGATGLNADSWLAVTTANQAGIALAQLAADEDASAVVRASARNARIMMVVVVVLVLAAAATGGVLAARAARRRGDLPAAGAGHDHALAGDAPDRATSPGDGAVAAVPSDAGGPPAPAGGATDTFVNIARRNQVLLGRQLTLIDALERSEEDPDALASLYRLDHLATRMRRNAESLLVLAGIDAGRRLREPMPLSDVIRTASGEIEHYERVDLVQHVDPQVLAHAALPTAHLLAEIIENATQFSPITSRVQVVATATADGARVTVSDAGLGMTPDELADATDRLSRPSTGEVVGEARLGFHVVATLAHRLGVTISLTSAGGGAAEAAGTADAAAGANRRGLTVTIDLPGSLLVGGSASPATAKTGQQTALVADRPGRATPPDDGSQVPRQGTVRGGTWAVAGNKASAEHGATGQVPPAGLIPPPAPSLADAAVAGQLLPRRARRAMLEAGDDDVSPTAPAAVPGPPSQPPAPESLVPAAPRPTPAPAQVPAPSQSPAPAESPAPESRPTSSAISDDSSLRRRAVLASEALSELSMLSSYRPVTTPPAGTPALARRDRSDVPAPPPSPPLTRPRDRGPTGVRTLLSGFTSGVSRARTDPGHPQPDERSTT